MIGDVSQFLGWIGVAVFALTGSLTAARKGMDPLGFALLSTVTGVGGGTLRDVLLGQQAGWVVDPTEPIICMLVGLATFVIGPRVSATPRGAFRLLMWADGAGLAIFAVAGAQKALAAPSHPFTAIVFGAITATFGGVVRDILAGETPLVLRREIYVTAAALGAAVFVALHAMGAGDGLATLCGVAIAFGLRALAIARDWSLPTYPPSKG
ncbi:MAG: trimeric intracellular cation channel family protein [Beijerinckiaceae bacterium]